MHSKNAYVPVQVHTCLLAQLNIETQMWANIHSAMNGYQSAKGLVVRLARWRVSLLLYPHYIQILYNLRLALFHYLVPLCIYREPTPFR